MNNWTLIILSALGMACPASDLALKIWPPQDHGIMFQIKQAQEIYPDDHVRLPEDLKLAKR